MSRFRKLLNVDAVRRWKIYPYLRSGINRSRLLRRQFLNKPWLRKNSPGKSIDQSRSSQVPGAFEEFIKSPSVFFITGRYKSGTSWLMRILNSHPEILCRGEGRFFGREWRRDDLEDAQVNIPTRSLYGALYESKHLQLWLERSVWTRNDDLQEHLDNLTRVATDYILGKKLAEANKKIVGDKTPFLTPDIMGDINRIYPTAKVIHIIRDGRDIAVSALHHRWNRSGGQYDDIRVLSAEELERKETYRSNPQRALEKGLFMEKVIRGQAKIWKTMVKQVKDDGLALLGKNYTEVRYEDLLENTEKEVRRLLEFLGAESNDKVVQRCVQKASFERLSKGRQRGEEDSTSFFRKGIAGDWKNVFTERDKQIFKEEAGDLLIELGYEKDGDW